MSNQFGQRNKEVDAHDQRVLLASVSAPASAVDHGSLAGLGDDDHSQYVHISAARTITAQHSFSPSTPRAPFLLGANAQAQLVTGLRADTAVLADAASNLNRSVIAGDGLTGGGVLTADRTLAVGAGTLITVGTDTVGITPDTSDYGYIGSAQTPWTPTWRRISGLAGSGLSYSAGVLAVGAGTMITVNADDVAISVGSAQYQVPLTGATPFTPAWSTTSSNPGVAIAVLRTDASGYLGLVRLQTDTIVDRTGSNLTIMPAGDVIFDPTGNDLLPLTNYDLNIGSISRKYLTLWAAELWVETLVAQDVISTIGGHVLVAPTTVLTVDLLSQTNQYSNPGFETLGGGGADVFANWTETISDGAITADTASVHSGTRSAKVTAGAALDTRLEQYISVTVGHYYSVTFWTRGDGTNAGRFGVFSDAPSPWLYPVTSTGVTSATWTRKQVSFLVPSSCTVVSLVLYCPGVNGGWCQFDDVIMSVDTFVVKHNQMAINDIVYMAAAPGGVAQVEWFRILSTYSGSAGSYTYYIQRDLDGTGINNWYAGDAVLNTGVETDGYIDMYSISSIRSGAQYGPTIQGVYRWGNEFNQLGESWAIGNLDGLYGYTAQTMGVGLGFYGWGYQYVTLDNSNGMRFSRLDGAGVYHQMARWYADGTILVGEVGTGLGNVQISSGAIALRNNTTTLILLNTTGYAQFGRSDGTYANMIWDPAGTLSFRSGTTTRSFIDTDGSFVINTSASYARSSAVVFNNSGNDWASLSGYGGVSSHTIQLRAHSIASHSADVLITSDTPSETYEASITIKADCVDEGSRLTLYTVTDNAYITLEADTIFAQPNFRTSTGGNIRYNGNLQSYKDSVTYTGYIFVPLTSPATSTSYDGDAVNTGTYNIDTSGLFGIPVNVKAVSVYIAVSWATVSSTTVASLAPLGSTVAQVQVRGQINTYLISGSGIVACDANGDIDLIIGGANATAVYIRITGYWI